MLLEVWFLEGASNSSSSSSIDDDKKDACAKAAKA